MPTMDLVAEEEVLFLPARLEEMDCFLPLVVAVDMDMVHQPFLLVLMAEAVVPRSFRSTVLLVQAMAALMVLDMAVRMELVVVLFRVRDLAVPVGYPMETIRLAQILLKVEIIQLMLEVLQVVDA